MTGAAIDGLNEGLRTFQNDISNDPLAQRRVEVAVVTFGNGGVQMVQDFVTAGQFMPPTLVADGATPMGEAIHLALDMVSNRKLAYKTNGIPYYRPWIFMITDGAPTDEWQAAAKRVHAEESTNSLVFFAVGVAGADLQKLSQISVRAPLHLKALNFNELFVWLSQSQKRVSSSKVGEQVALPPVGWGAV
jgi:uncharacterized protein YegL